MIPDQVIAAQENDRLVIFAGAGVSRDKPADLWCFEGLTREIGRRCGETITNESGKTGDFDRILGDWESRGKNVHDVARDLIGKGQDSHSAPNSLHCLLVALFPSPEKLKIVTTNFDLHFSSVFSEKKLTEKIQTFTPPALPAGDDFNGLVYLHGNIGKNQHIVLTDKDFGRAYLTEGWARRFLLSLYRSDYTILFVGYSHKDLIVSYLSKGIRLNQKTKSFAFQIQDEADETPWENLGVIPIYYHNSDGEEKHSKLVQALRIWEQRTAELSISKRDRIHRIVKDVESDVLRHREPGTDPCFPELSKEQGETLLDALRKEEGWVWFSEIARDFRWVQWLHSTGQIPSLVPEEWPRQSQNAGKILPAILSRRDEVAKWAITCLLNSHSLESTELLMQFGGRLGREVTRFALFDFQRGNPIWNSPNLGIWLAAIVESLRTQPELISSDLVSIVEDLVDSRTYSELGDLVIDYAMEFFSLLIHPTLQRKPPSIFNSSLGSLFPSIYCDAFDLVSLWRKFEILIETNPKFSEKFLAILFDSINWTYVLLRSTTVSFNPYSDPFLDSGLLIEEKIDPATSMSALNLLSPLAVAAIKCQISHGQSPTLRQIESWIDCTSPFWSHFGYFALKYIQGIGISEKLDVFLTKRLYAPKEAHLANEVIALFKYLYDAVGKEERERMIGVLSEEREPEGHPPASEHEGAISTIARALIFSYPRDSSIRVLEEKLGIKFSVNEARFLNGETTQVDNSEAEENPISLLSKPLFREDCELTQSARLISESHCRWQKVGENSAKTRTDYQALVECAEWFKGSWKTIKDHPVQIPREEAREVINTAINHPVGWAVDVWIRCLAAYQKQNPPPPEGWPMDLGDLMERSVARESETKLLSLAICGRQLALLNYYARNWTKEQLLPILTEFNDGEATPDAEVLWVSWLHYGTLSQDLASTAWQYLVSECCWFMRPENSISRVYPRRIAQVAFSDSLIPSLREDLIKILDRLQPEQVETCLMSIMWLGMKQTEPTRKTAWEQWIEEVWRACNSGRFGGKISENLFKILLDWVVVFPFGGEKTFSLICKSYERTEFGIYESNMPFLRNIPAIRHIISMSLFQAQPDYTARLLKWISQKFHLTKYLGYCFEEPLNKIQITTINERNLTDICDKLFNIAPEVAQRLNIRLAEFRECRRAPGAS